MRAHEARIRKRVHSLTAATCARSPASGETSTLGSNSLPSANESPISENLRRNARNARGYSGSTPPFKPSCSLQLLCQDLAQLGYEREIPSLTALPLTGFQPQPIRA